ncbi:MAG: hypothetical protein Q9160_007864 [Pyrenula sp. 1 TL-2023]
MPPKRRLDSIGGASMDKPPEPKRAKAEVPVEVERLAEALYNYCNNRFTTDDTIQKEDLFDSNIFPERKSEIMRPCLQYLTDRKLFKIQRDSSRAVSWRIVNRAQAAKYSLLSNTDEHLVYATIENSGHEGIWNAMIKNKTGVHQTKVQKVLNTLVSKGLVKHFKNPDRHSAKMYILKDLEPANVTARGPFYKDGELDEELVWIVGRLVLANIAKRSFIAEPLSTSPAMNKKGKERVIKEEAESIRDFALNELSTEEHSSKRLKAKEPQKLHQKHRIRYRPHPPGYSGYPTLDEIAQDIEDSGAIKIDIDKTAIQRLLNVLVLDNVLHRITRPSTQNGSADLELEAPKVMYKTLRDVSQLPLWSNGKKAEESTNALTEIPCGRCPVIDLCEEGGVVSASTCTYWDQWLKQLDF